MKDQYDVIVIGAGINGLACSGYLAKCGLKVALFEARNEVGTMCETEENMRPGVRCNMHASAIASWMSPAYEELELERFGYKPCAGDWGYIYPFLNGTALVQHNYDAEKTYQAFKSLNLKDAETYRDMCNYFGENNRIVDVINLAFYSQPTPEAFGKVAEIISKCPHVPEGWGKMTGYHVLDCLFEDERIKVGIIATMIAIGTDPWLKIIGPLGAVLSTFGPMVVAMFSTPKGGSHLLPHSLYRSLIHYGGEVFQACPVDKIIVEDGEAKGIVLSEDAVFPGKRVMATKAVVSNLDPVPTFLWLVGEKHLSPEVAMAVQNFDDEQVVLFTNYYLLKEPLRFKSFDWVKKIDSGIEDEVYMFNFSLETVEDTSHVHYCYTRGELPDPPAVVGGCFRYTAIDPTQAPEGMHTVLTWADVPYNLRRWGKRRFNGPKDWDAVREEYADRIEERLAEYAPNLKTAKVERYVQTPLDTVRRNQSRQQAGANGGTLANNQWGANRPFPGCGAPRTPIRKLYTTDVGMQRTTLLTTGYLAADGVAKDLGVRNQPWWNVRALTPYINYWKRQGKEYRLKF